jgi:hypothetical protein
MDRGAMALFGLIRLGSNLFLLFIQYDIQVFGEEFADDVVCTTPIRSDPIRAKGSHVLTKLTRVS